MKDKVQKIVKYKIIIYIKIGVKIILPVLIYETIAYFKIEEIFNLISN